MRFSAPAPDDVHEQRFSVPFEYPVVFTEDALAAHDPALVWAIARLEPGLRHATWVALDAGLAEAKPGLAGRVERYFQAHSAVIELRAEPRLVPGGERAKNDPELVSELQRQFAAARLDRHAVVLIVGGGAVLDAVGYAAATTHRGLRVVRMPSTVLAQSDGGVGVKNGVNGQGAKNFVGTFAPPHAVVNDAALLETLPLRAVRAGLAEAVKVALIRDAELFEWIESHAEALRRGERGALLPVIRRAARLHLRHIAEAGDPFELGSARPLDYGHWSAHWLEIESAHALQHGEAVAIGMALDARYAEQSGLLPTAALERVCGVLERLGLPLFHAALDARASGGLGVLCGLEQFREHLGGALTVTLLSAIGRSLDVSQIDAARVASAVEWLRARAGSAELAARGAAQ